MTKRYNGEIDVDDYPIGYCCVCGDYKPLVEQLDIKSIHRCLCRECGNDFVESQHPCDVYCNICKKKIGNGDYMKGEKYTYCMKCHGTFSHSTKKSVKKARVYDDSECESSSDSNSD